MSNFDPAHIQTDRKITEIERRITVEYKQAEREITKKLNDHLAKYQTKDKIWQQWVHDKKRTQEEYEKWRVGQLAVGDRWEEMRKTIAQDLMNTDKIAKSIAYGYMPEVYALNHDYGTYQIEHGSGIDTSYTLYSREAAERIFRDNPQMLPAPGKKVSDDIARGLAERWNNNHIQSVMMQAILQGNSIPDIATRLANTVGDTNRKAAIRNARTMATAAQNAGRIDSYKRANAMGIKTRKQWMATLDSRTRHEHRILDGQREEVDEPFVNRYGRIRYPGDPAAAPANVYNCRCTLIAALAGHEIDASDMSLRRNDKLKGMSYEDWKKGKNPKNKPITAQEQTGDAIRAGYINDYRGYNGYVPSGRDRTLGIDAMNGSSVGGGVVNGRDISQTWQRREGQFDFEIEDVISAQGFDGKPRIVSKDEFEKAVKDSGFVAQRTYSAPDKETLDAYRDQLYHGKWYVDCSTGGAQYGQGMYCAADYSGKITEGMKNEMRHYQDQYMGKYGYDLTEEEWLKNASPILEKYNIDSSKQMEIARAYLDEDDRTFEKLTNRLSGSERDSLYDDLYKVPHRGLHNNVETFTLDPSAKVITHRELNDIRNGNLDMSYRTDTIRRLVDERNLTDDESTFVRYNLGTGVPWEEVDSAASRLGEDKIDGLMGVVEEIGNDATRIYNEEHNRRIDAARVYQHKYRDNGSLAASLGYDAINAEGHGQSGSYTVILNRTKVIFLGE